MPLVKTIIEVGPKSRAVILPKSYLDFFEEKHGAIKSVMMEVTEAAITIRPLVRECKNEPIKEAST